MSFVCIDRTAELRLGRLNCRGMIVKHGARLYAATQRLLPSYYRGEDGTLLDSYGFQLHRSGDGETWQGLDNGLGSAEHMNGPAYIPNWWTPDVTLNEFNWNASLFADPDGSKLYLAGTTGGFSDAHRFGMFPFNLATEKWEAWDDFGFYETPIVSTEPDSMHFIGFRSNGDLLVAYQSEPTAGEIACVTIQKRVAGVWSTVGTIGVGAGPEYDTILRGAVMDDADNLHLLLIQCSTYASSPGNYDLFHVSVSAADVVSSLHPVDTGISTDYDPEGMGSVARVKNGTLAYVYVPGAGDAYPANGGFKIAFADLSGDPLDPSWSTETVSTTHLPYSFDQLPWGEPYYLAGGAWNVVFRSKYPGAQDSSSALRVWKVARTGPGTWGTPSLIYTPVNITTAGPSFCLQNDLEGGVGILVADNFNGASVQDTSVMYDGPSPTGVAVATKRRVAY